MSAAAAIPKIPVKATYRIIDGKPIKIAANYADIPADTIARLLIRGFGLPVLDNEPEAGANMKGGEAEHEVQGDRTIQAAHRFI